MSDRPGIDPATGFVHVTHVLKTFGLMDQYRFAAGSATNHKRRGRLIDLAAPIILNGGDREIDPAWEKLHGEDKPHSWALGFGNESKDIPCDCGGLSGYLAQLRRFRAEHPELTLIRDSVQQEVRNEVERYVGHVDFRMERREHDEPLDQLQVSLKTGGEPAFAGIQEAAYAMTDHPQTAYRTSYRRFLLLLTGDADKPAVFKELTDADDYARWTLMVRTWHLLRAMKSPLVEDR